MTGRSGVARPSMSALVPHHRRHHSTDADASAGCRIKAVGNQFVQVAGLSVGLPHQRPCRRNSLQPSTPDQELDFALRSGSENINSLRGSPFGTYVGLFGPLPNLA